MPWETAAAVQVSLVFVVMVISIAGNGTVGALLIRFKKLRTVPNIIIANMTTVDLLNSLINMPVLILVFTLKVQIATPKAKSFVAAFLFLLFQVLNLYSMVLIALDRYGAIVNGINYMLWKTRKKAYVFISFVWIFSFMSTAASFIPRIGINIENGTTSDYRKALFKTTVGISWLIQAPLTIIGTGILSVLTWQGMYRAQKSVRHLFALYEIEN